MGLFDYFINFCEALTSAYIAINYAELKDHMNKYVAFVIFALCEFSCITLMNLIIGYESFYFLITSIINLLCLVFISKNSLVENLIEVLLLCLVLSLSLVSYLLPTVLITGIEVSSLYEPPHIYLTCIFNRIFHFMWGWLLIRFQSRMGHMTTEYNSLFLLLILIIYLSTICVENIMIASESPFSNYSLYAETGFVLILLVIIYFMYLTRKKYLLNLEKDKLITIQSSMNELVNQFKNDNEKISIMRHDMINQMTLLQAYLTQNDIEKAQKQLEKNIGYLQSLKIPVLTGNANIDAIINSKVLKAKNAGIQFSVFIDGNSSAEIDDVSYAILLGNAMDNAIEHNRKDNPYAELLITQQQGLIKIIIKNPTDKKENSDFSTTKTDSESHGFGMKSMQTIVDKYHGHILFQHQDYLFKCTIFLPKVQNK